VQEFQVLSVPKPALRMKKQTDSNSRRQKDFICKEKRKTAYWGMQEDLEMVVPWVGGIGFYSLFVYCLRAEMPFRCRWMFPGGKKCLLDLLQYLLHKLNCSLSSFVFTR
jgi:hypothetical protein